MSLSLALLAAAAIIVSAISSALSGEDVFSAGGMGDVFGRAAVDFAMAIIVAMIPAGVYWLVKRRQMPHLAIVIWAVWGAFTLIMLN